MLVLLISSCATMDNSSSTLYHEYSQYSESANKNNIIEMASDFFSPSLLGKSYRTNPDAINQLLFKNYMATTESHYEKINGQVGCLTINGNDEENFPLALSLEYELISDRWLINKIHVVFIENEFVDKATCPNEYLNE